MTKDQEIKILQETAEKLGRNSYLGETLRVAIPFLESEMRSDFLPDLVSFVKQNEETAKRLQDSNEKLEKRNRELEKEIREKESRLTVLKVHARNLRLDAENLVKRFSDIC